MEIKATEASSIARLFRNMIDERVGTIGIEKTAKKMALEDNNKRGNMGSNNSKNFTKGGGVWTTKFNRQSWKSQDCWRMF